MRRKVSLGQRVGELFGRHWIDCFEKLQGEQKKRAMECVSGYAKMVGVGTAACPWKAGKMAIREFSQLRYESEVRK